MNKEEKCALFSAICWTVASQSFWIALLIRGYSALSILTAVTGLLSMINAVIWWINYAKRRREEASNEEKESP